MLIILGGLPGTGKTSVARAFCQATLAVHVRIDSIEQAIQESGVTVMSLDDAGYRAGYAVAEDNLRLGHVVVADSVNLSPDHARCLAGCQQARQHARHRSRDPMLQSRRASTTN